jgi:DNA-binding MarR family transcriptional regulator
MDDAALKPFTPQVGEGKRGENGYLGYVLRQAAGAYRHRVERALADLRVTPPQFFVLTMLAGYPGISNADLARLTLLTPQTVSTIVANLERAGAIARQPHHYHGRIQQIDLSETGKSLLATCRERVQDVERHMADGLSQEEELVLRKWLVRVATSAPR